MRGGILDTSLFLFVVADRSRADYQVTGPTAAFVIAAVGPVFYITCFSDGKPPSYGVPWAPSPKLVAWV